MYSLLPERILSHAGRLKFLAFDLLVLGQQSVYFTEVDADVASYIALYHTGNHIVLFLEVLIKQNLRSYLTDLLKNDVFGILVAIRSVLLD